MPVVVHKNISEVQPEWCRKPIERFDTKNELLPKVERVLFFNPESIYEIITERNLINPFSRHPSVSQYDLFPQPDKTICSCGCGVKLTGRQKRWASDDCRWFAGQVWMIIAGYPETISRYRSYISGHYDCEECGDTLNIELDHLHPIKFGGGGGWLSNYKNKCRKCHRIKTNKDFGFKTAINNL